MNNRLFPTRIACLVLLALCITLPALRAETTETDKAVAPVKIAEPSEASRYAIGLEAGTVGYGPVLVVTASKYFTANVGYTWLNYNYDYSDTDGDYNGKLKFSNLQAIANWHPFAGTFHLSVGAFISDNKVDATGVPNGNATFDIGDTTYTASQVGTLKGTTKLSNGVVPFVGLGWSKKPTRKGFGFFCDLGVMFTSSPKTTLSATGPIASNATFQANLHKEEQKVNDELDAFRYYPVVQFGLMYRF